MNPIELPPAGSPEWIGSAEAADLLAVHRSSLKSLVLRGLLTCRQVGRGRTRFIKSEVVELAQRSLKVRSAG